MRSLSLLIAMAAASSSSAASASSCVDGLYMIVARGSDEAPGTGVTGAVADEAARQIKGSKVVGLAYPATFANYISSEQTGAQAMRSAVEDYHDKCPHSLMALLGYSQGAQVTTDAVCGSSEKGFKNISALPMDIVEKNVVAIVLFGDPSHVVNTPYDRGTATHDGLFPRKNVTLCDDYASEMVSYCDQGDIYCDSGNNATVHDLYVEKYGTQMADWIVSKYTNATKSSSNSSSSSTTTTATGSTSTGTSTGTATGSSSAAAKSGSTSTTSSAPAATTTAAAAGLLIPGTTVLLASLFMGFMLL